MARAAAFELPATVLEKLDVGVAEAVDRLLGVADHEQIAVGDLVDQAELHTIGVLQLVDHHALAALSDAPADLGAAQQPERQQFEILEVDGGPFEFERLVALAVERQQPLQRLPHRGGLPPRIQRLKRGERPPVGVAFRALQRTGAASSREREHGQLARPQRCLGAENRTDAFECVKGHLHLCRSIVDRRESACRARGGIDDDGLLMGEILRRDPIPPCDLRKRGATSPAHRSWSYTVAIAVRSAAAPWAAIRSAPSVCCAHADSDASNASA